MISINTAEELSLCDLEGKWKSFSNLAKEIEDI